MIDSYQYIVYIVNYFMGGSIMINKQVFGVFFGIDLLYYGLG